MVFFPSISKKKIVFDSIFCLKNVQKNFPAFLSNRIICECTGYLIHPGAASVLSQPGWLPGHQHVPVHEKQPSPLKPSKDNSPNRFR